VLVLAIGFSLEGWLFWQRHARTVERRAADALASQYYPAPGRMIDVGGRRLHLLCTGTGTGQPTVILAAGGNAYAIDWTLVQPRVADSTRVCSWDRAGLGWSEPGPADESIEQTTSDLHTLLARGGERGPFILAGASVGGIFIQAYQHAYPEQVAGLVFSNSSDRIARAVKGKTGLIWELTESEIRSTFPLPASAKGLPPTREDAPYDRLLPELQSVRLWLDVRLWQRWDPTNEGPESTLSWRNEFLREFAETDSGRGPPLGNLPVIVVSNGPAASEAERRSRAGAAARLDFLSSNTVHITAQGSGHEIHLYQPDVLVAALLKAVAAVRTRAPLSGSSP
jgi:pimeloyl-ACP methyl ester carboxylesterase